VPEATLLLKVIDSTEVVHQDWIEVGTEDLNYDIVFSDVFKIKDKRDGREYSALKIDSLSWIIENLAYLPYVNDPTDVSFDDRLYYVYAYEGGDINEAKENQNYNRYGVLYNWKASINACPEGWRLPTDEDWKSLEKYFGMEEFEAEMQNWRNSGDVGIKLKDSVGWLSGGRGDNSSWFNALPGGYNGYNGGAFGGGYNASFWTSTKCRDQFAYYRSLKADESGVFRLCNSTRLGYSVRCVR
jgi:uncharacterized protein (TIGR02145 family)